MIPRPGVIPSDKPTVPIAEAVSNKQVSMGKSSSQLIAIPPAKNRVRYINKITAAFLIVSSVILLPKHSESYFLLNTAINVMKSTAIVVVFIPPAVEPGEPPISINRISIVFPLSLKSDKSTVLNPAVLGVTV